MFSGFPAPTLAIYPGRVACRNSLCRTTWSWGILTGLLNTKDPIFEYVANATKVLAPHTIRFGYDINRQHENHIETAPTNFNFTGGVTSLNGGPSANQYNQIADFLLDFL